MLDKSDDMLGEEMDRTETLTENLQRLQSKLDNLQSHHKSLLSDHEKLYMLDKFSLGLTTFKVIITLSYLIMRCFPMNFFKGSKILKS